MAEKLAQAATTTHAYARGLCEGHDFYAVCNHHVTMHATDFPEKA